jgi:hypothetical protein
LLHPVKKYKTTQVKTWHYPECYLDGLRLWYSITEQLTGRDGVLRFRDLQRKSPRVATLLGILLLMLMMPATVSAQIIGPPVNNATVRLSGNVLPTLSAQQILIEPIFDVQFAQDTEEVTVIMVDPIRDLADPETGAGYFIAKGEPNASFQLFFNREVILTCVDDGSQLMINYIISSSQQPIQDGSIYVLEANPQFQLNTDGEHHF